MGSVVRSALAFAIFLFVPVAGAVEPASDGEMKPACGGNNVGQFWPEAANGDRARMQAAFRSGELEICSYGHWHYRWQALSVRYSALKRRGKRARIEREPTGATDTEQAAASR